MRKEVIDQEQNYPLHFWKTKAFCYIVVSMRFIPTMPYVQEEEVKLQPSICVEAKGMRVTEQRF